MWLVRCPERGGQLQAASQPSATNLSLKITQRANPVNRRGITVRREQPRTDVMVPPHSRYLLRLSGNSPQGKWNPINDRTCQTARIKNYAPFPSVFVDLFTA